MSHSVSFRVFYAAINDNCADILGSGRGYYVGPTLWSCAPRRARLYQETVFAGRIRWKHLARVRRMMENWPVDNVDPEWEWNSWIFEILAEL